MNQDSKLVTETAAHTSTTPAAALPRPLLVSTWVAAAALATVATAVAATSSTGMSRSPHIANADSLFLIFYISTTIGCV